MVWSVLSCSANTLTGRGLSMYLIKPALSSVLQFIVVLHTGYDLWLWLCGLGQWHMENATHRMEAHSIHSQ